MVDANKRVIFDKGMETGEKISVTTNKATGCSMIMRRERNVWAFDAFIDEEDDFDNANRDLGFARHD